MSQSITDYSVIADLVPEEEDRPENTLIPITAENHIPGSIREAAESVSNAKIIEGSPGRRSAPAPAL